MTTSLRATLLLAIAGLLLLGPGLHAQAVDQVTGGMTVDQIIAKSLETRGGLEAIKAVESARMEGTMSMGPGMDAPFTILYKRPNKIRMEFEFQGMTGVQAYDGETGWGIMPFMGKTDPEPLAGSELDIVVEMADFDGPLVDYKDKGHEVELLGTEDVEGTEAYALKVTKENGNVQHSYFDTEHFLEFRQQGKRDVQGNELEIVSTIGDYKEVGGILMPFSIEQEMGGMGTQTISIDTIDLDVELDDALFSMPEVESKPAAAEQP